MHSGRTAEYAIWNACLRFNIRPPGVKDTWEETDVDTQAMILSMSQIKDYEEAQMYHAQN